MSNLNTIGVDLAKNIIQVSLVSVLGKAQVSPQSWNNKKSRIDIVVNTDGQHPQLSHFRLWIFPVSW